MRRCEGAEREPEKSALIRRLRDNEMCRQHGKPIEASLFFFPRSANDVSEPVIPLWPQGFFPC